MDGQGMQYQSYTNCQQSPRVFQQVQQIQKPEYVNQITNITRDDCTFYAEGVYEAPKWEDYLKNTPVLNVANKFRIDFFIFKPELKKSAKYSFSSKECEYLFEKTKGLINQSKSKDVETNTATPTTNSLGYTVKLRGGNFNGKTPVEVLAEDSEKRNALIAQANYLAAHMTDPRFAASNQQQIAAIQDAITLFDAGALQGVKVDSTKIVLWNKMKTPNNKVLDAYGNTKARTIKISYDSAVEQSFHVEIMNCMAPPVQGAKVGAYLTKAVDNVNFKFDMSEVEWFCFLQDIIDANQLAKNMLGSNVYGIYEKYRWKPVNK